MADKPIVTKDDPICQCGKQKHDHFGGTGASAVPDSACQGFKIDQRKTDAAMQAQGPRAVDESQK